MMMSKRLIHFPFDCFLVLGVTALLFATESPAQTINLDEFVFPADEPTAATSEEAKPAVATLDKTIEPAPRKEEVAIPWQDLLGAPGERGSDPGGIDLLVTPDSTESETNAKDELGGDEPGNANVAADAKEEEGLQPLPMPESVADKSPTEHVSGGKQPSSWLSLNGSICSHWVRLSRNGELRGEINVLQPAGRARRVAELKVAIYRNSKRVGEDVTDKAGKFSFSKVKSGVYSLLVTGPDGFAAYGIHALAPLNSSAVKDNDAEDNDAEDDDILPVSDEEDVAQRRLPHDDVIQLAARKPAEVQPADVSEKVGETLRITTAAVPPVSFGQLKAVIREYGKSLDPQDMSPPPSLSDDAWDDLIATAVEEKKPGYDEPEGPEMYRGTRELEKNPVNHVRSPALGNFDVPLLRCGDGLVMRGRMVDTDPVNGRPLEVAEDSTTLTLIRNDQRVATTKVRAGGVFEFRDLTPGIYSIVAVGDVGFGALSFRAVEKESKARKQANDNESNIHFVQHQLSGDPCDPCNAPLSGDFVIGGPASAGGCSVPLCCDPACARDAVAFSRPIALAATVGLAAATFALDDAPAEFGGVPAASGGFQGTAGGGGGGAGAAFIGAIGLGSAALALDDDDPVASPSQ